MSETHSGGPRVTAEQIRDLSRLRRPTEGRMVAGVAAGIARHLDIDPVIVRVVFGALTVFGGAGLLLYAIAWLTIPDDRHFDSVASDLLRRDPEVVMSIGLVLAAVVAGMTMMGTLVWSSPNPWPVFVFGLVAVVAIVAFTRRPESPLPPPVPPAPPGSGGPYGPSTSGIQAAAHHPARPVESETVEADETDEDGETVETGEAHEDSEADEAAEAEGFGDTAAETSDDRAADAESTAVLPGGPSDPGEPTVRTPSVPPPPPPPHPPSPRSRLLSVTLCLVLLAEGAIWIVDRAGGGDVHPSVYPGTALGIVAAALIVGTWYGRSRLLILVGAVALLATAGATVVGPGPYGARSYTPRTAAEVEDRYEHGTGELVLHLEEVADVEALDGRTIEIDQHIGQVTVYVPTSVDATIEARVTSAGSIHGLPEVREAGHGDVEADVSPVDDADPNITLDVSLSIGDIDVQTVVCPASPPDSQPTPPSGTDTSGASNVPAACN